MRWGSQPWSSCWVWVSLSRVACSGAPPHAETAPALLPENQALVAFARVYGYVRWLGPGDEAFEAGGWSRFAVASKA